VKDLSGEVGKSASYTVLQKTLPWIVPAECGAGFKLTRAGHTGTSEMHIAVGFDAGRYDLILNGQTVGTYDEEMLSVHAEIEEDPDSPTHQQALKIAELNKQRNAEAINPLRGLYSQRKGKLRAAKQANDLKPFEAWVASELKPKEAELLKKAEAIEAQIHELNDLAPVKVEIKPTASPAPAANWQRPDKSSSTSARILALGMNCESLKPSAIISRHDCCRQQTGLAPIRSKPRRPATPPMKKPLITELRTAPGAAGQASARASA